MSTSTSGSCSKPSSRSSPSPLQRDRPHPHPVPQVVPASSRRVEPVELGAAHVGRRPDVDQFAIERRVPDQRRQIVDHHGDAHVVDRRVRGDVDRPVGHGPAPEEPEITGAGEGECFVEGHRGRRHRLYDRSRAVVEVGGSRSVGHRCGGRNRCGRGAAAAVVGRDRGRRDRRSPPPAARRSPVDRLMTVV